MTGLASGLDIDSMVKELMKARRTTYDNMVKKRTKVEWQQEDYRSMATKIVDFRNNKLASFKLANVIGAKTSDVSGDTNALTVNSTSATSAGSLTVKVNHVATAANTIYTFNNKEADGVTDKKLKDLGFALEYEADGVTETGNILVKINGVQIKTSKEGTLSELAGAINAKASTSKATALYDSASGKFSISATKTGETDAATYTGLTVETFAAGPSVTNVNNTNIGSDADITVNGLDYKQASNQFTVAGFNFTIKSEATAMITARQDTTKIVDTIKSFITEYNSLISSVNSELSEKKNYDYKPLTSDEKEEMTEDDIKNWEAKARSGLLKSDSSLSTMISQFRLATNDLVKGIIDSSGNALSIGITTGSYSEKGKLVLDEDKLQKALSDNPDAVIALFSDSTNGVFSKMTKSSMTALENMSKKAGTSLTSTDLTGSFMETSLLGDQIRAMKNREKQMLDRLDKAEDQYYKTFSAMETAINKFNSQSSSLSSYLQ
nr:flagellar filament capping protein FliD [Paenibacillus sp. NEAU-GSW1]